MSVPSYDVGAQVRVESDADSFQSKHVFNSVVADIAISQQVCIFQNQSLNIAEQTYGSRSGETL